jgi:hypothetical protein
MRFNCNGYYWPIFSSDIEKVPKNGEKTAVFRNPEICHLVPLLADCFIGGHLLSQNVTNKSGRIPVDPKRT